MMRTVILLAALVVASGTGWVVRGCWHARPASGSDATAQPKTAKVVRGRIEATVKARGIVRPAPNALVRIGFPMPKDVSRRIRTLKVVEGDTITTGRLLAELDTS